MVQILTPVRTGFGVTEANPPDPIAVVPPEGAVAQLRLRIRAQGFETTETLERLDTAGLHLLGHARNIIDKSSSTAERPQAHGMPPPLRFFGQS